MSLGSLATAIAAICPIDGVCLRTRNPPVVEIQFRLEATEQQRAAAQAIADGWGWSEAAEVAREEAAHPERTAVRQSAAAAIAANSAYLAIASPTAAETRAQVERLTRQMNVVLARIVQL